MASNPRRRQCSDCKQKLLVCAASRALTDLHNDVTDDNDDTHRQVTRQVHGALLASM